MIASYLKEEDADNKKITSMKKYIDAIKYKEKYSFLPKNEEDFLKLGYNPVVIHHMHSKWMDGKGLTLFRRLAQYYIRYAGIWEELCKEYPGYCIK